MRSSLRVIPSCTRLTLDPRRRWCRIALLLIALSPSLPSYMAAQDANAAGEQAIDSAWVAARMQRISRRGGDSQESRKAFQELVQGGARVLPFVERAFRTGPIPSRQMPAIVLAHLGRPGVAVLVEAVRDTSLAESFWAKIALESSQEPEALEGVASLVADRDPAVRQRAMSMLGTMARYGENGTAASALIRPVLRDSVASVRAAAADALWHVPPGDSANVTALVSALSDPDANVRTTAALAMVGAGGSARTAVPALIERLRVDPSPDARMRAAQALGSIGDTAAVPALLAAYADPSADVRGQAIRALGLVGLPGGADAQRVLDVLTALAVRDHGDEAQRAAGSLAQLDDRAIPSLLRVLAEGSDSTAPIAAASLGFRPARPDVVEGLYRALGDRRAAVRGAVADAVAGFGSAQLPRLRTVAAGAGPSSTAAARAVRTLQSALVSPIAEMCYELRRGAWTPVLDLGEDSAFSAAPAAVRFTTQPMETRRGQPAFLAATLAGARRSRYLPDAIWTPVRRDGVTIVWSTGFSGVSMDLHIAQDGSLTGTASPFWDFPRERQSAPVIGTRIPCREEPSPDPS